MKKKKTEDIWEMSMEFCVAAVMCAYVALVVFFAYEEVKYSYQETKLMEEFFRESAVR